MKALKNRPFESDCMNRRYSPSGTPKYRYTFPFREFDFECLRLRVIADRKYRLGLDGVAVDGAAIHLHAYPATPIFALSLLEQHGPS